MNIGLRFIGNKEPEAINRVGDKAVVKFKDGTTMESDYYVICIRTCG